MPRLEVVFYREDDTVWVREWLKTLPTKAQRKCLVYIDQLEILGHELRRPAADFLRDGIYELRPSYQDVQYRILYFFSGKGVAVLSHGITKEDVVPEVEINRAINRKKRFEADRKAHTYMPGK